MEDPNWPVYQSLIEVYNAEKVREDKKGCFIFEIHTKPTDFSTACSSSCIHEKLQCKLPFMVCIGTNYTTEFCPHLSYYVLSILIEETLHICYRT